ncbi:nesprin-2 isoform X2 [Scophthalmus maximus]|nr:nesprin-2 isoform X2 [Scophthalmus maximus]
MSGCLESDRHGDVIPTAERGDNSPAEEEWDAESSGRSRDGDVGASGWLERKWILWHEFMKEHAHLDAWLRLAEQAVSNPNPAHVTYTAAKEELSTFERLRCEAGSRLVQLDSLTCRNRTLTWLFLGAMRARLLAAARECGRRWDDVSVRLEYVTERLKLFVSEWEEFEAEREELALWLADLDVRLTEVDHLNGNTCEKLRRLQSFQQCVCENSCRVNALLQRGEALVQRSEATDAQRVERRLLELLRHCSHVYNNIARTHTRLLSMRLVFEDDWILSPATDSGCPSESLLEDEGALDKPHPDLPVVSDHLQDFSQSAHPTLAFPSRLPSPVHHRPPPPPPRSSSSPTHEHLGLEWDPSVDIGRSVSHDDGDSSYFSVGTGLCHRDSLKRRSFLSSLSCQSDITEQEAENSHLGWLDHTHLEAEPQWATSTPDRQDGEPVGFDGRRVRAWLGVQSPAPPERRTSCSKAVQTDGEAGGEPTRCEEAEQRFSEQSETPSSSSSSSPSLLYLVLAAALALLACLIWVVQESPCRRGSVLPRSFHLMLRYVNGPPPT